VIPQPEFWVLGAKPVPHAAAPTLAFEMRVRDHSELEVYAVALTVQILLQPVQRPHDDEVRERLRDVFGEAARWGDTARSLLWSECDTLVGSFRGSTSFELQVPCSSDLELATTRWFDAVPDGEAPLSFQFSGSVFYCGEADRLQLTRVGWHTETQFRLPLETWRATVGERGGLVRVSSDTFEALRRYRLDRGLHSLDAAVADLLDGAHAEIQPR
jgi:Family of unknown function (DUF6084)